MFPSTVFTIELFVVASRMVIEESIHEGPANSAVVETLPQGVKNEEQIDTHNTPHEVWTGYNSQ